LINCSSSSNHDSFADASLTAFTDRRPTSVRTSTSGELFSGDCTLTELSGRPHGMSVTSDWQGHAVSQPRPFNVTVGLQVRERRALARQITHSHSKARVIPTLPQSPVFTAALSHVYWCWNKAQFPPNAKPLRNATDADDARSARKYATSAMNAKKYGANATELADASDVRS